MSARLNPGHRSRGQASSDYLLGLGLVLILAIGIMLPALKGDELSIGLAAARLGAYEYVSAHPNLTLESMAYVENGSITVPCPRVIIGGDSAQLDSNDSGLQAAMYSRLSQALAPFAGSNQTSGCVTDAFRTYCVYGNCTG